MVFSCFGSGRQSWQLQASKASFLVGSESDVRHWHRGLGSAVGTGMPWCFPVSEAGSCRPKASFLAGSESEGTGTGASEGAVARRPGPSLSALLFGCGAGAVLGQTAIVFL